MNPEAQPGGLQPRSRIAAWASGQIAVQIYRDAPSLLLLFYMTQVLGIGPALAGSAIFVPKLVVAILADLGAGWLSDRLRRQRRRALLLLLSAVAAPVFLVMLFEVPGATSEADKALHVTLVLTAYMIMFSLFSVPHLALGTQISPDPHQRTEAMAWRSAFSAIGLLMAAAVAPTLVERFGGGAEGYRLMAWILAGAGSVFLVVSWLGSRHVDALSADAPAQQPAVAPLGQWRALLQNRAALALLGAFTCQLCAMGMAYATLTYLFSFNLAFERPFETIAVMVLVTSIVAMSVQPMWVALSRRITRRRVYAVGIVGYTLSLSVVAFAPPQNALWVYVGGGLMGLCQSACFTMVFALLSDVVERDRQMTGDARAGFFAALFSIIDKVGFALGGTLLIGLVLQGFGFAAGQSVQTESAMTGIAMGFAVFPAVFNVASLLLMLVLYPAEEEATAATA